MTKNKVYEIKFEGTLCGVFVISNCFYNAYRQARRMKKSHWRWKNREILGITLYVELNQ